MDLSSPLYFPFIRDDQYGTLGCKPQPWWEYIRLVVLALTVAPLKFLGCFACVSFVWVICRLSFLVPAERRQELLVMSSKRLVRVCLWFLGFQKISWIRVQDFAYTEGDSASRASTDGKAPQPAAIVSNHVSWADILVHLEHSFCSFVARSNTADTPLIGLISVHLQCILVNRDFKRKGKKGEEPVKGASGQVVERMQMVAEGRAEEGTRPLLLFPEGTTTNGRCLLPFKTGAFLAGAPVQPVVLKYKTFRIAPAWESIGALWHVFLMLANLWHEVICYELPIYLPDAKEREDPKLYARNVRAAMMRFGGFESSDSNLLECRAYIALLEGKAPPVRSTAGQALLQGQKLPADLRAKYFDKID